MGLGLCCPVGSSGRLPSAQCLLMSGSPLSTSALRERRAAGSSRALPHGGGAAAHPPQHRTLSRAARDCATAAGGGAGRVAAKSEAGCLPAGTTWASRRSWASRRRAPTPSPSRASTPAALRCALPALDPPALDPPTSTAVPGPALPPKAIISKSWLSVCSSPRRTAHPGCCSRVAAFHPALARNLMSL